MAKQGLQPDLGDPKPRFLSMKFEGHSTSLTTAPNVLAAFRVVAHSTKSHPQTGLSNAKASTGNKN